MPEVGADGVGGAIFGDGFESGDLTAWSIAVGRTGRTARRHRNGGISTPPASRL